MVKGIKAPVSLVIFLWSVSVGAQCIDMNAPGPPRLWDGTRGCYVPQGTPAPQQYGNQFGQAGILNQSGFQTQTQYQNPYGQQGYPGIPPGTYPQQGGATPYYGGQSGYRPPAQPVLYGCTQVQGGMICYDQYRRQVVVPSSVGAGGYPPGYYPPPIGHNLQPPIQPGYQPQRNPCAHDPGTREGVVGNPQLPNYGRTVCARPGDTNISRWL
jgi:hypothetical protein